MVIFFCRQIRRVVDISGRVEVTFDNLAKDLGLSEDYTRQVVFDVIVKEDHTERIQVLYFHSRKNKETMSVMRWNIFQKNMLEDYFTLLVTVH